MRNVILVTKLDGEIHRKCFLHIDKIVGVEVATSKEFRIYFDNAIWYVPSEEYTMVMNAWAPYYNELPEYKEYINR